MEEAERISESRGTPARPATPRARGDFYIRSSPAGVRDRPDRPMVIMTRRTVRVVNASLPDIVAESRAAGDKYTYIHLIRTPSHLPSIRSFIIFDRAAALLSSNL